MVLLHLIAPGRSSPFVAVLFELQYVWSQVLKHRAETLLAAGRSVVIAGDFNIAPKPIDHCDWHKSSAARQAHFYDDRPDREWFLKLLQEGGGPFVDSYRAFHPADQHYAYTVWNQATNARKSGNRGSRVDFILVAEPPSKEQTADATDAEVLHGVRRLLNQLMPLLNVCCFKFTASRWCQSLQNVSVHAVACSLLLGWLFSCSYGHHAS